jgi:hypothetical protein
MGYIHPEDPFIDEGKKPGASVIIGLGRLSLKEVYKKAE